MNKQIDLSELKKHYTSEEIATGLLNDLEKFIGEVTPSDDIAILVAKWDE